MLNKFIFSFFFLNKILYNTAQVQEGYATFYGKSGLLKGACSYDLTNSLSLSFIENSETTIAFNDYQFNNSQGCGTCIIYRNLEPECTTCGTSNISSTLQTAVVTNLCPECSLGDIDLAVDGNGRYKIEWKQIPCNVGDSKLHYGLQNSNPYYVKLQISNSKYPIKSVKLNGVKLSRSNDNYFVGFGYFAFPSNITITSIFDQIVYDIIDLPFFGNTFTDGNVQFS